MFSPNKRTSLRIGDRGENNKKKVGEENGTNGGKRTEGVSGIENVRRPWDPIRAPKSRVIFRVFFVNPSKIPGNIFKCYVYSTWRCAFICVADATLGGGSQFLCSKLGLFCVFFFWGVGDVFLIQSVN